jgi:hypothetical protein
MGVLLPLCAISRLWLFGRLREKLPGLLLFFMMTPLYLEFEYLKHRKMCGSRRMDTIFLVSDLALILSFVAAVLLWRMATQSAAAS